MDLIKCPRCGEDFSPSYRKCPFCEEGDHPRRGKYTGARTGRRGKKQTYSARSAMAGVLVVVIVLLGWALFGDRIFSNTVDDGSDAVNTEQNGGTLASDTQNAATDDNAADQGDAVDPDGGTPPDITGGDTAEPSGDGGSADGSDAAAVTTVDPASLSVKTNVGTTLPRENSGDFGCTIGMSESIRLSIAGTDAAVTWSVADTSVLTISSDGLITPLKSGMTTITAAVGGVAVNIIVRIR